MRLFLTALFCLFFFNDCFSQTKFIISVSEISDFINRDGDRELINIGNLQTITFTQKRSKGRFKSKFFETRQLNKKYDGNSWSKTKDSSYSEKHKKSFTKKKYDSIISMILSKDNSHKRKGFLHTSHHYLNYNILIINGADSIKMWKSKPFDSATCWWITNGNAEELYPVNLDIDLFLYNLLPRKFIARDRLLALPRKNEWDY